MSPFAVARSQLSIRSRMPCLVAGHSESVPRRSMIETVGCEAAFEKSNRRIHLPGGIRRGRSPIRRRGPRAQWRETHERAIVARVHRPARDAQPRARCRRHSQERRGGLRRCWRSAASRRACWKSPGAPPVVYGEIAAPGATRTIVFYAHYDGQPLDPKEWATPPWQPVLRDRPLEKDGRPIPLPAPARSIPSGGSTRARRATTRRRSSRSPPRSTRSKAAAIPLRSNLKFVFEGEEEAGSPHLAQIIAANKDLLAGDVWLICDGPVHQSRRQQIVFGARGVTTLDITVYGPKHELHSGHYGNWAPNPAMMLARLLASMKDDDGRVLIDAFLRRHRAAQRDREARHRRSAGRRSRPDARAVRSAARKAAARSWSSCSTTRR